MKKLTKLPGIIVFIAAIGLSIVSCGGDYDGGGNFYGVMCHKI